MSVTVVSGVPGVGSSRICEEARRSLDDSYGLVNFGDVMLEEAMSYGMVGGRDEIAGLPVRDHRVLQRRVGEEVARRARERSLILDTRFVIRTSRGFLPGLPAPTLDDIDPTTFVSIEADPDTIVERRGSNEYRNYPDDPSTMVSFHQAMNRTAAMNYAIRTDTPIMPITNEGRVEEASESLVRIVESVQED